MEETICETCEASIFVAVVEDDYPIWSHIEDTDCDEPVPAF